ncbi:hypothetical protein [Amycolatopsis lurida]|uniref:hypothetical protein n=1 Tax=Amycolatopsis lurida TaxID=31959 RepID=UPI00364F4923
MTGGRLESSYVELKSPVRARMEIVRTSLASPWVTILADVARTSSPVAYTATGLFALHRLLQMVMTWQRHRIEIDKGRIDILRQAALDEIRAIIREAQHAKGGVDDAAIDRALEHAGLGHVHRAPDDGEPSEADDEWHEGLLHDPTLNGHVSRAASRLAPVQTAVLLDSNDPKVTVASSEPIDPPR